MKNFIECVTLDAANEVDLKDYVFLEKLSVELKRYCFKVRQKK